MLHSGKEAEAVVTALLKAHPEGAKGKDKVRGHTPDFSHPRREFLSLPHPHSSRPTAASAQTFMHDLPSYRTGIYPLILPCEEGALLLCSLCWSQVRPLGSAPIASPSRW